MADLVGKTILHYRITEQVGQGGMGVVYKAEDTKLERTVALKFLSLTSIGDEEKKRFKREAKAAASLNHPNIATIFAIDEADDQTFIAMEFIEGKSLQDIVGDGHARPLPLDDAVNYATQTAAGLQAAHEKGITHRDIKSANIMVTDKGQIKIMDFGLAKLANRSKMTQLGTTLGTAAYMSPEQSRGENTDHRSDIWSLGVVLYEMISGQIPFKGDYEQAVIYSIQNEDPEPLTALRTGVPIALDAIIAKALAKDPATRYQHVDELPADLKAIDHGSVRKSRISSITTQSNTSRKAHAWFAPWRWSFPLALATFMSIAAIGSWLWSWRSPQLTKFRPAQTQIVLPLGLHVAVDTQYPALALSPDGSRLVFVGDEGGIRRLYLRDLAAPEPRVVAGTEDASAPFFSPLGDWIGFFAGGSLKKVPVEGGMPISVHAATGMGVNRGATWSTDDTVIYAASANSGLQVGSVAGDAKKPYGDWVSVTDPTAHYAWPHALPGGDHALFADQSQGSLAETRVSLLSVRKEEVKTLIQGGMNPRYSPTGHILFARDGSLYAVPFDPRRDEVTGSERKLLDGLMTEENGAAQFAVGGGGTLTYIAGGSVSKEDELVWVDRQGNAETLLDNGRRFLDPRLSPDGTRLAVTSPTGANFDIWLLDLERSTFDRLTSHPGEDITPVWSPNGDRLALASEIEEDAGGEGPALALMPGLNTSPELLIRSPDLGDWEFPTSWSPNGRWLAYTAIEEGAEYAIWLLPMDEAKEPTPFLQSPAKETAAMFSPDGRWIAYVSDVSGQDEVYVQRFPEPGERIPVSTRGGIEPVWSRDGRELFYREGDKLMVVELGSGKEFEPKTPEVLFEGRFRKSLFGANGANYDVSPGGGRFVMVRQKNLVTPTVIHIVLNWPDALGVVP